MFMIIIIKLPVMFTNNNVKQSFQSNTFNSELYPEFTRHTRTHTLALHTHTRTRTHTHTHTPALHTVCLAHYTCDDQIPGIVLINALNELVLVCRLRISERCS